MTSQRAGAGLLQAAETVADNHPSAVTYLPGASIMREGERGSCAYLIESGQVRVSTRHKGAERDIAVLGPGELIGEMAPIDDRARSASVRALTQVSVTPISREHLEALMEQSDPLLDLMLRAMFGRLSTLR